MTRTHIGAIAIVVMLIVISAFFLIPREVKSTETIDPAPQTDLQRRQEVWLHALETCESGGREDITILDTNDKYSYGILQFQMSTFLSYGKKYGVLPKEITYEEALTIIHNRELQEKIARYMLADGLEHQWKTCYHKINEDYPRH